MVSQQSKIYACVSNLFKTGHHLRKPTGEHKAIVLAGECSAAGYVRLDVKGPPYRVLPGSAILTEAGRQMLISRTAAALRESRENVARKFGPAARANEAVAADGGAPSLLSRCLDEPLPLAF